MSTPQSYQWTGMPDRILTEIRELTDAMTQMDFIDIYRTFTQTQHNIPSSQHLMEPFLKLTTHTVTKQNSTDNLKNLENTVSYWITMA